MTHTTSDKLLKDALDTATQHQGDQTDNGNDGLIEKKPKTPSKLSRKGWGLVLGGVLVLAGGTWGISQLTHPTPVSETAKAPVVSVETLTITSQAIANTLELSGTVSTTEQATLSTRVMGRIIQLSLESGDRFQKGDILTRIDVMDMTAQTGQAELGVAQAQAEVARAQAALNQLESQKLEAQSALGLAQINQSRMAQLQAEGAVSQSQLDQANSTLAATTARVAQAEAGIRQSEAAIAQTQAAVSRAELSVTSADINESYGTVIAPFDGVVVQKLAYEGEMAAPGTPLLKVENPNKLQLEIAVPEENLQLVRVGQLVEVRFDAVNQTLQSTIQQIVPAADPKSRSFLVKIPLRNSGRLISGMFGRIVLPVGKTQEAIFIPAQALIQRGQLQGVYVVETRDTQPTAVLRWVKTGKTQDKQIEIVSGLIVGDRIITDHLAQLRDGQPINLQP